jgi:hypothetical protein
MAEPNSNRLGWLTAILLSIVTLFVFGSLQNFGPESAVRRFHVSAQELNPDLARSLVADFDTDQSQQLWRFVSNLLANEHATFRIISYNRQRDRAALVVQYQFSNGRQMRMVWAVARDGARWIVDTRGTALAAQYLLSP